MVRTVPKLMSTEQNRRISQVVQDLGRRLMRFIRVRVSSEADAVHSAGRGDQAGVDAERSHV